MKEFFSVTIQARNTFAENQQGRAVTILGEFADNGREAIGTVGPDNPFPVTSGQHLQVAVLGVVPIRPINVISAGAPLTVTTSGFFTPLVAATNEFAKAIGAGTNFQTNINSNALGYGVLGIQAPWTDGISPGPLV
jgi:hypothetical protein